MKLQQFSENHWWPLTAFPLKILDNVSSNESSARIAPPIHRGSTGGVLKFQPDTNISNTFLVTIPEIFGSLLLDYIASLDNPVMTEVSFPCQ